MVAFVVLMAILMFWPAGRIGWTRGWIFLVTYIVLVVAIIAYLWRANPEIIIARSKFRRATKRWDSVVFFFLFASFTAMFPVAGLDDGRFYWSAVPLWLSAVGYALVLAGMIGNTWVMSVNKFAEPMVRIQSEREHKVIDTGPYAIVRHPLYATSFFLCAGIPLALGSYWAFVPAAVGISGARGADGVGRPHASGGTRRI